MTTPTDKTDVDLSDEGLRKAVLEACYLCNEHGTVYDRDGNETPCPGCGANFILARTIRDAALSRPDDARAELERVRERVREIEATHRKAGLLVRADLTMREYFPDLFTQEPTDDD